MRCSICSVQHDAFGSALVLQRHEVTYFRCPSCGFIQTEPPYWLEDSYAEAVTDSDVGLVQRNLHQAAVLKVVIDRFFPSSGTFIDYGGGYGLLTRLMRDKGYDFYCYDKHCLPILARRYRATPGDGRIYELGTAFEVVEHFVDPLDEFGRLFAFCPEILFTTEVVPPQLASPAGWWYFAPEHGQHVSFYTTTALAGIARLFNKQYVTNGRNLHLFSSRKVSPLLFDLLTRNPIVSCLNAICRRTSLIQRDLLAAMESEEGKQNDG